MIRQQGKSQVSTYDAIVLEDSVALASFGLTIIRAVRGVSSKNSRE